MLYCKSDMASGKNEKVLSIIIPVYNGEKYIANILSDIVEAAEDDIEVLIINDGSEDKTKQVCLDFINNHEGVEIKYIEQKNNGASAARNTGIKKSTGRFVYFIDCDDNLNINNFRKIVEFLKSEHDYAYDIIVVKAVEIKDKIIIRKIGKNAKIEDIEGIDFLNIGLKNKMVLCAPWLYICRREFILNNDLYFEEGLKIEDERWVQLALIVAKHVLVKNITVYIHNVIDSSCSHTIAKTKVAAIDLINTCLCIEKSILKYDANRVKYIRNNLADLYLWGLYIGNFNRNEFKIYCDKWFLLRNARKIRTLFKSMLACISPEIYVFCNKMRYS